MAVNSKEFIREYSPRAIIDLKLNNKQIKKMKKTATITVMFVISLILMGNADAQTINGTTYPFSVSSGAALEVPTGTVTQLIGPNADNPVIPYASIKTIGFDFWFAGTRYTQFSVNENGLMKLSNSGGTPVTNQYVNSMASTTNIPKIAPYWDDLATGTNGSVTYWLSGEAPNRKLIVQWNVTVPKAAAGNANAVFQVWLNESGSTIDFVYGDGITLNNGLYSAGIGSSGTQYASITTSASTVAYGVADNNNSAAIPSGTKFTFSSTDIASPQITYTALTNTTSTDNRIITATIIDQTGAPTAGLLQPRIYFKKYYAGTYVSTQGQLASGTGANGTWTFTIDHSLLGGVSGHDSVYYFVVAQDMAATPNISSNPAGAVAPDVNNVTSYPSAPNKYKVGARLSGIKTVGTSGADYPSLTKAGGIFEDINDGILTGNLTINIITDLTAETGAIALKAWANESGGPYSITINPVGARTVSGSGVSYSGSLGLITLSGTNGVTIDGLNDGTNSLTFENTNASSYSTLLLVNGASNNIITRATFKGRYSSSGSGVVYLGTGASASAGNNYNNINNCVITAGQSTPYDCIYLCDFSYSNKGNIISNNTLSGFGYNGIHIDRGYLNSTISNNEIYQTAPGNYSYGIYIYNPAGSTKILHNKIYDLQASSNEIRGIYYRFGGATDTISIYNNLIHLNATVTNPAVSILYGLDLEGAGTCNVYYNSIYIGGSNVTSGNSAGLYRTAGKVNFMNNAIYNARSLAAPSQYYKNYGIKCTNVTNFVSNNNLIYADGIGGVLANNGTDRATLEAWVAATGKDSLSFSGNPGFTSPSNLMPDVNNPNSFNLNGNGAPLAFVGTDFSGNSRSTSVNLGPTDIGAYEFTPETSPAPASVLGNIQAGDSTSYYVSGKLLAKIYWTGGTSLPDSVTVKYFSGESAPGIPGTNNGIGYWEITASGGTDFTYNIKLNYIPTSINTIASENKIKISKTEAGSWTAYQTSVVNTSGNTVMLNGLNSFSLFALTEGSAAVPLNASIKVFLQGPFSGTEMTTALNSGALIPLSSENAYASSSYGYSPRSVTSIPNSNIVDWIIVELRSSASSSSPFAVQAGFIKNDGTIVDIDGSSPLNLGIYNTGNYYIVIRHRNHLAVMSSQPVSFGESAASYDFTNGQSKAYGTEPMADLKGDGTVFGMYAGSSDGTGFITTNDYNTVGLNMFGSGYSPSDHNMNGFIFVDDYNPVGINLFKSTQVP